MNKVYLLRRPLAFLTFFLLFFYYSFGSCYNYPVNELKNKAINKKIYNSSVWKSLLHYNKNKSYINDPSFILSIDNFSLKNEMLATIELLNKQDQSKNPICAYPARFYFIQQELDLTGELDPLKNCNSKSFEKYKRKVPYDNISLVFASAKVADPSSMMGHIFIKVSGQNSENYNAEHAISFFTVIDTFNVPKLIIKSTILGMDGIFSLMPYDKQKNRYLKENRNLWIYDLNISEYKKKLIFLHIWELKDVNMTYLFTGYNCATVIHFLLSMAKSSFLEESRLWVTPLDVLKEVHKQESMVSSVKLIPSPHWYIRMLTNKLSDSDIILQSFKNNNVLNKISDLNIKKETDFLSLELISSYSSYLNSNNMLLEKKYDKIKSKIKSKKANVDKFTYIDISKYKSPANSYDDSQFALGIYNLNNKNYLNLKFLPTSHYLQDDNRNYFSESSLELGSVDILVSDNDIKIKSLNIYSMKSLLPFNKFTKGLSSRFKFGIDSHFNEDLKPKTVFDISGGSGLTYQYDDSLFYFIIGNLGLGIKDIDPYLYAYPEFGLIAYEKFNMKSVMKYRLIYNQLDSYKLINQFQASQSFFVSDNIRLEGNIEYLWDKDNNETNFGISVSYYF